MLRQTSKVVAAVAAVATTSVGLTTVTAEKAEAVIIAYYDTLAECEEDGQIGVDLDIYADYICFFSADLNQWALDANYDPVQ